MQQFSLQLTFSCLCLALAVSSPVMQAKTPATTQSVSLDQKMEDWWADLAKGEPWEARATLDFADHPAETVAFFKTHLKPLKIDKKVLDDALTALASDDEKIWKPAYDKLVYFDPRLNEDVLSLFNDVNDPLARSRLAGLLTGNNAETWKDWTVTPEKHGRDVLIRLSTARSRSTVFAANSVSHINFKLDWQRADRALVVLQHIGTPDAIELLKDMGTGNPHAQPTKVALAALDSLGQTAK